MSKLTQPILWGGVAVYALAFLLNSNPDGGVRYMMRTHGVVLAIGLAVTLLFPVSKFHLLWVIPIALVMPIFLMSARAAGAERRFKELMEESKRTGVPFEELLNRETAKMSGR